MMNDASDESETKLMSVELYYVQSPDSHEGKSLSHEGTTPRLFVDSPSSNSVSSLGSRVSGTFRVNGGGAGMRKGGGGPQWRVIEEEEEDDDEDMEEGACGGRRRGGGQVWAGLTVVVSAFGLFCLVMWAASRRFTPKVSLQKLVVNDLYTGHGMDWSGVPTKMLTMKCLLRMRVHSPATFFGIHVSSTSFNLKYYHLTIASGKMEEYYQPRKSWRNLTVEIQSNKIPLYGAGTGFEAAYVTRALPLRLEFEFRTRGDVVGWLVKTNHHRHISCPFTIDPSDPKSVEFVGNSCRHP